MTIIFLGHDMHIARSKEHNGSNSREERPYLLNLEKASHQPHSTQTFWCCLHEVTAFATWLLKYKQENIEED